MAKLRRWVLRSLRAAAQISGVSDVKPPRLVVLSLVALIVALAVSRFAKFGSGDFIAFWAPGRLLLEHHNPYDPAALLTLERANGRTSAVRAIAAEPPWCLWFLAAFALFPSKLAWALWISSGFMALLLSLELYQRMYGDFPRLAAYVFPPVAATLVTGQAAFFLLLAVMLFLYWEKRLPVLAGTALLIAAMKPHLFLPFWTALLVRSVCKRDFRPLAGLAGGMAAASAFALIFDPQVFSHNVVAYGDQGVAQLFIPSLAGVVRALAARKRFWVQFVPAVCSVVWAGWYAWKWREDWDWRRRVLTLLVAGFLCTPYEWFPDEAVLLPPFLWAAGLARARRQSLLGRVWVAGFVLLGALLLMMILSKVQYSLGVYFWSAALWAGWYGYGTRLEKRPALGRAEGVVLEADRRD